MVDPRVRARERNKRKRQEALDFLGNKCVVCGSVENLEFDHIDPKTKTTEVQWLLTSNKDTLLAELKKCQLLCSSCHLEKTRAAKVAAYHGLARYKRGCRCTICKQANSLSKRIWRANKRVRELG